MSPRDPDLPPFVNSWRQLYTIVLGALVAEIIVCYALMTWLS